MANPRSLIPDPVFPFHERKSMPKRKKEGKKGLTKEQLEDRLKEIAREAKELDAKIQRLQKEAIGTVRVI